MVGSPGRRIAEKALSCLRGALVRVARQFIVRSFGDRYVSSHCSAMIAGIATSQVFNIDFVVLLILDNRSHFTRVAILR